MLCFETNTFQKRLDSDSSRLQRRTYVSSVSRSTARQKLDQDEAQYRSVASTVALKTSFIYVLYRQCWLSTHSTYSHRVHVSSSLLTFSAAVIWSLMTSTTVSCLTLSIPGHVAGSCVEFPRLPFVRKKISFVFVRFKLRLQPCAQS